MDELIEHHISGQLRVAPEHVSDNVLSKMGKPGSEVYREFVRLFEQMNRKTGKEQYIVPYLMSSHPGSRLKDAIELAEYIRELGYMPEQVQDFYPTPGTISTCIFYTGLDPYTLEKAYVPRTPQEKALQRALLQYFRPENHDIVEQALIRAGRTDLIGNSPACLIRPSQKYRQAQAASSSAKTGKPQTRSSGKKSPIRSISKNKGKKKGKK